MSDFTALVDLSHSATNAVIADTYFCDWINGLSTETVRYTKSDGSAGYIQCTDIERKGDPCKSSSDDDKIFKNMMAGPEQAKGCFQSDGGCCMHASPRGGPYGITNFCKPDTDATKTCKLPK